MDFYRESVISRCIEWKAKVVCADEFDRGQRQLLNLGHTVAHAIEALTDFTVPHGYAVGMGTAIFARAVSQDKDAIVSLLEQFGLPTETEFSAPVLAHAALSDKKRQGGTITLVLPHAIGDCRLQALPVEELATFIKAGL